MTHPETIFVQLPDEPVDTWRPVQAEPLGNDRYGIIEQPYDRTDERWQFEPGDVVRCEHITVHGGTCLAAVERISLG
jgi:hypothetical protein